MSKKIYQNWMIKPTVNHKLEKEIEVKNERFFNDLSPVITGYVTLLTILSIICFVAGFIVNINFFLPAAFFAIVGLVFIILSHRKIKEVKND